MIDLLTAALLWASAVPAASAAPDHLNCASGGTVDAVVIELPAGTTRVSGVARRTVARPGGRRIPGTNEGFWLRIGLTDARHGTVAGLFLNSGPANQGPPQAADHFFGWFGRYRHGAPFEFAPPLEGLTPYVIARVDSFRFTLEIAQDGAIRSRMSWAGEGAQEAGGLVPAGDVRPTRLVLQCEVDDFAIDDLSVS